MAKGKPKCLEYTKPHFNGISVKQPRLQWWAFFLVFLSEEESGPELQADSTQKQPAVTAASQRQKLRKIFGPHEEGHEEALRNTVRR